MLKSSIIFAAALLGAAVVTKPAAAQDFTTASFGGTTVWVGGGVQFLSLPDIKFTRTNGHPQQNTESDWLDFGGATGGGIETALGNWGGWRVSGSVKGFWAGLEDDHNRGCKSNCVVVDPTGLFVGTSNRLYTVTDREADYWGGSAELKFATGAPIEVKPEMYRNDYFIAGFDVRGIDQDNRLRSKTGTVFNYTETLDTTYTGGYIGFGGEYSFGFIPVIGKSLKGVGGIYDRLGLRTYLNATAGIYNAETDYTGRFTSGGFGSRISQSSDDVAFIGTVSLETRKQLGERTSLSLWTDYEFISSVPKMQYADGNRPTRIDDESVFATRTMLRLNIGLGSQQLYADTGY
jgi:hypothetical protein